MSADGDDASDRRLTRAARRTLSVTEDVAERTGADDRAADGSHKLERTRARVKELEAEACDLLEKVTCPSALGNVHFYFNR